MDKIPHKNILIAVIICVLIIAIIYFSKNAKINSSSPVGMWYAESDFLDEVQLPGGYIILCVNPSKNSNHSMWVVVGNSDNESLINEGFEGNHISKIFAV